MNLLFQDPFLVLKEYPEKLSNTLQTPLNTECIQFSPKGEYLAVGCVNGSTIIYDLDVFQPMCVLGAHSGTHVRSVQSLCWSPCGRYLLTASRDWYVKLWDLADPSKPWKEFMFEGPVWNVQWVDFENCWKCITTVLEEKTAFILDFESNTSAYELIPLKYDDDIVSEQDQKFVITSTVYPKNKNIVITGTSKGWINFYDLSKKKLVHNIKIGNCNIKQIIISENGNKMAVNCSDKTIRQYSLQISIEEKNNIKNKDVIIELELQHKYQDVINKLQWNSITFSNKFADYIVASTHGSLAHELYIWETHSGTLVRVLEGAEEELMDIDWNFYNMRLASNGLDTGYVYIWSIVVPPKWSALAPDFEEVEENIEYIEKEDEFDEVDEQEQQQELDLAEEEDIDLVTQDTFDVRRNDLTKPSFVIPIQYEQIILMQTKDHN